MRKIKLISLLGFACFSMQSEAVTVRLNSYNGATTIFNSISNIKNINNLRFVSSAGSNNNLLGMAIAKQISISNNTESKNTGPNNNSLGMAIATQLGISNNTESNNGLLGLSTIGATALVVPVGSSQPGSTVIAQTNISFNRRGSGCVFSGSFLLSCSAQQLGVAAAPGAQVTPPVTVPVTPPVTPTPLPGLVTPAPVPLPAAVWLLISGLLGLLTIGRRKNQVRS